MNTGTCNAGYTGANGGTCFACPAGARLRRCLVACVSASFCCLQVITNRVLVLAAVMVRSPSFTPFFAHTLVHSFRLSQRHLLISQCSHSMHSRLPAALHFASSKHHNHTVCLYHAVRRYTLFFCLSVCLSLPHTFVCVQAPEAALVRCPQSSNAQTVHVCCPLSVKTRQMDFSVVFTFCLALCKEFQVCFCVRVCCCSVFSCLLTYFVW